MINHSKIRNIAVDLVGWRQTSNPEALQLDTDSLKTDSGLVYDDVSALVNAFNVQLVQDNPDITATEFNTLLDEMVKGAFVEVLRKIFSQDDFIDSDLLYKHENTWDESIDNDTDFVGYEINIPKNSNVSVIINNILLEFIEQQTVKILVFNSAAKSPVKTLEVTAEEKTVTEGSLKQTMNSYEYWGGRWFIGYLRSGLTKKAAKRNFELADLPYFFGDLVDIKAMRIDGWDTEEMFDMNDIEYTSEAYGLNMELSLYRDFTELVLTNRNRFASALQYQVAVNVVDLISNSIRSNKQERLSKSNALLELAGNKNNYRVPELVGLHDRLIAEIKNLRETYYPTGIRKLTLY